MDAKLIDLFDRLAIWAQRRGWLNLVELRLHLQVLLFILVLGQSWTATMSLAAKLAMTLLGSLIFGAACFVRWRVWKARRDYPEVQRHQQYLNAVSLRNRENMRFTRYVVNGFLIFNAFLDFGRVVSLSYAAGLLGALQLTFHDWFFNVTVWGIWFALEYFDCSTHVGPGHAARREAWSRDVATQGNGP